MSTTETWSAKLDVETKQKLNELIAAWRGDPTEPINDVIDRIVMAATATGDGVPSEVLEATGTVKDTVLTLLKQVNGIGAASANTIADLHSQLDDQIAKNTELQEKMQSKINEIGENHKTVVQGLKDRITELKNDNDRLAKESATAADALTGYKTSVSTLTEQLSDSKSECEKLNEQLRIVGEQLQKSEDELKALTNKHSNELTELSAKHEQAITALKDQHKAALKTKVEQQKLSDEADLKAKVAEVRAEMAEKQTEKLEKLHEKLDELKDEKLDLVQSNEQLKNQLADLQRQLVTLQQQQAEPKRK